MLFAFTIALLFCIFQFADMFSFSYPWHASCQVEWVVPGTCESIKTQLIDQMNLWEGDSNCGKVSDTCPSLPCGQNCLYEFTEVDSEGTLKAKHLTPVKRYVDSLSFKFIGESNGNCKIEAYSRSDLWYAVLDYGTNYCNLRNLLDGTGLSGSDGFQESTRNKICTQYTSRDCSRF